MMKAGEYFVGDLCYVLGDRWDEICELTIKGHECLDGEFELSDGTKFASYGTKYGDGVYTDQHGNQYPVDAGLIGCVEIKHCDGGEPSSLGAVHTFDSDFETGEDNGLIWFDTVEIETGDTCEDDHNQEDEDYDDNN